MSKVYAVRKGIRPGVYLTWDEAKCQVHQFKGAEYKSFKTRLEADNYLNNVDNQKIKDIVIDKQQNNIVNNNYNLTIYTDGSYRSKKGGYGIIFIKPNKIKTFYGRVTYEPCTNNIAELYAIKQALELVEDKTQTILIKSDSMYAINSIQGKCKATVNIDLINECIILLKQFDNITFERVYSHEGEYYNEIVDQLAKQGTL